MVKIRLTRTGRKNAPSYRIVVVDQKNRRDGRSIEVIGHYNPTENPDNVVYKKERYEYWTSVGAQPSDAVKKLVGGKYVFKPYNPNAKDDAPKAGEEPAEVVESNQAEQPAAEEAPAEAKAE